MGELGQKILEKGGKLVGLVDQNGYEFKHSKAIINNKFMGLPLDEDTQEELTEERLNKWLQALKEELGF
jgi:flavodoxin I